MMPVVLLGDLQGGDNYRFSVETLTKSLEDNRVCIIKLPTDAVNVLRCCELEFLDLFHGSQHLNGSGITHRSLPGKQVFECQPKCAGPSKGASDTLDNLGRTVLQAICRSAMLNISNHSMLTLLDHIPVETHVQPSSVLHVSKYDHGTGSQLSCAAHTDRGFLTLVSSRQPGLQVQDSSGDWVAVNLKQDEVAVLVGYTLQEASAGKLAATLHRIVPATKNQTARISLAYKLRGRNDAVIHLPTLLGQACPRVFRNTKERTIQQLMDQFDAEHPHSVNQLPPVNAHVPAVKAEPGTSQQAKKPRIATDAVLQIVVEDVLKHKEVFRIKSSTQLETVTNAYCEKMGIDPMSVRYLYDGRRVDPSQTPHRLEMQDGSCVHVLTEQVGD